MKKTLGFVLIASLMAIGCGDDTAGTDSGTDAGGSDTMTGSDTATTDTPAGDTATTEMNIVETARAAGSFTTLVSALERTGLDAALSGEDQFTVFAPTDAAFTALGVDLSMVSDEDLTVILQNHVVAGAVPSTAIPATADNLADLTLLFGTMGGVTVNGATVDTPDVAASNGVIHIIDAVLMPANIVDMAGIAGFTELAGALGTASGDLIPTLQGDAPFTVFAPTNEAFEAISETVAGLTPDQLRDVLLFHVVMGTNLSTALTAGEVGTLLEGQSVTVDLSDGVQVESATVTLADVKVTNGVIHVINAVMVPPS